MKNYFKKWLQFFKNTLRGMFKKKAVDTKQSLDDYKIVTKYLINYKLGDIAPQEIQKAYTRMVKRRSDYKGDKSISEEQLLSVLGIKGYKPNLEALQVFYARQKFEELWHDNKQDGDEVTNELKAFVPTMIHRVNTEMKDGFNKILKGEEPWKEKINELIKLVEFYTMVLKDYRANVCDNELDGVNINVKLYDPNERLIVLKKQDINSN